MPGRGRPRKYPKEQISNVMETKGFTSRGAQNYLGYALTFAIIGKDCSEATQRYFFGGRTSKEALNGEPKKFCVRNLVMQELGRHPIEEIAEIAEAIANNRTLDTWTQQDIANRLKDIRLGRK
jgi:hypothetical protein